ncbi:MAG: D-alanyl-D-alanine carboxypeptidase [Chitinophagaceae bacterium]|nr:D-alanyl-D-alanine carboxypeptidase [Chitinophagaceae bacterium]
MKNSYFGKPVCNGKGTNRLLYAILFIWVFSSCSVSRQIGRQATAILLQDSIIGTGHTGISIYEPATNTYLYNYNAAKYFIPASNTKLFTLYAGMKYLGDSLVGLRYNIYGDSSESWTEIKPSGDPTFLEPSYSKQPVFDFLKKQKQVYFNHLYPQPYGNGWAWDDYNERFMTRRSDLPIYKNLISVKWVNRDSISISPSYFDQFAKKFYGLDSGIKVYKNLGDDRLMILSGKNKIEQIPFDLNFDKVSNLLKDTLPNLYFLGITDYPRYPNRDYNVIHSQPTDSLLKPMMHNSDNFFAEQTLLMASNEHLGYMNDEAIIDTLLKSDLKDIPQPPRWVDGSGLSRYNLFTPQSFIYILNKLKNEFGLERLKRILPTGGEGTLKNYYNADSGFIYAKTGSMSNQVSLCGYLITKKMKLLVFSVLVNNEMGNAANVRRAIERFIKDIRNKY